MDLGSSLALEEQYYQTGYSEGAREGHAQGLIEGRIYGSEQSYERFFSLGLCYGRISTWQSIHAGNDRILKHIGRAIELADRVPRINSETAVGEDYESSLGALHAKMRVIASICGDDSLSKDGIIVDARAAQGDLEDGAEYAAHFKGRMLKGCGS